HPVMSSGTSMKKRQGVAWNARVVQRSVRTGRGTETGPFHPDLLDATPVLIVLAQQPGRRRPQLSLFATLRPSAAVT
ncbi:MAG: hypothetical protein ABI175_19110, partial [Polyangiales bacterium]